VRISEKDKNKDKTRQNRAREWKEREKTSPTVPSLFIGPALNPLYGPGQPILEPAHNFALVQQVSTNSYGNGGRVAPHVQCNLMEKDKCNVNTCALSLLKFGYETKNE
ncbi:hypothetical protein Tco_0593417, partial [Tanacetum coccineum]